MCNQEASITVRTQWNPLTSPHDGWQPRLPSFFLPRGGRKATPALFLSGFASLLEMHAAPGAAHTKEVAVEEGGEALLRRSNLWSRQEVANRSLEAKKKFHMDETPRPLSARYLARTTTPGSVAHLVHPSSTNTMSMFGFLFSFLKMGCPWLKPSCA